MASEELAKVQKEKMQRGHIETGMEAIRTEIAQMEAEIAQMREAMPAEAAKAEEAIAKIKAAGEDAHQIGHHMTGVIGAVREYVEGNRGPVAKL